MSTARTFAFGALAMIAIAALGCDISRFPVCKSNEECAARDGGAGEPVCYNLKCVECRYDADCAVGSICLSTNVCQGISAPQEQDKGRRARGSSAEPKTWDECAETCQDSDCVASCNRRFQAP